MDSEIELQKLQNAAALLLPGRSLTDVGNPLTLKEVHVSYNAKLKILLNPKSQPTDGKTLEQLNDALYTLTDYCNPRKSPIEQTVSDPPASELQPGFRSALLALPVFVGRVAFWGRDWVRGDKPTTDDARESRQPGYIFAPLAWPVQAAWQFAGLVGRGVLNDPPPAARDETFWSKLGTAIQPRYASGENGLLRLRGAEALLGAFRYKCGQMFCATGLVGMVSSGILGVMRQPVEAFAVRFEQDALQGVVSDIVNSPTPDVVQRKIEYYTAVRAVLPDSHALPTIVTTAIACMSSAGFLAGLALKGAASQGQSPQMVVPETGPRPAGAAPAGLQVADLASVSFLARVVAKD